MTIKFPNDKANSPDKLADAELHFTGGLLNALKLQQGCRKAFKLPGLRVGL